MRRVLDEDKVREIHRTVEKREALRDELKSMTNKALAEKYGVHVRTIDKVTNYYTWWHVEC